MQHCVSGMWCNLVSASTAMPSHIEKHTREQERSDMNVFTVTIAITWLSRLPNWTTVMSTILFGFFGAVDNQFSDTEECILCLLGGIFVLVNEEHC